MPGNSFGTGRVFEYFLLIVYCLWAIDKLLEASGNTGPRFRVVLYCKPAFML